MSVLCDEIDFLFIVDLQRPIGALQMNLLALIHLMTLLTSFLSSRSIKYIKLSFIS